MDLQLVNVENEKLRHVYQIRVNRQERLNAICAQMRHDLDRA